MLTDGWTEKRTPISHPATSRCDNKQSVFWNNLYWCTRLPLTKENGWVILTLARYFWAKHLGSNHHLPALPALHATFYLYHTLSAEASDSSASLLVVGTWHKIMETGIRFYSWLVASFLSDQTIQFTSFLWHNLDITQNYCIETKMLERSTGRERTERAGKTKIMICGMGLDLLQSSGKSVALEWAATAPSATAASTGCTRNALGSSAW